ncbi:MAG: hypothetical protein ACM3X1_07250 [Ignavibacteriales bacterium]
MIRRTLIVVLYAAIIRRDVAAGSLALAHKDMLAGINGWLAGFNNSKLDMYSSWLTLCADGVYIYMLTLAIQKDLLLES